MAAAAQWRPALPPLRQLVPLVLGLVFWCGLTWRLADVRRSPIYRVGACQPCASGARASEPGMRPEPAPTPCPALQAGLRQHFLPPADQASKRETHTLQMAKLLTTLMLSCWLTSFVLLLHYVAWCFSGVVWATPGFSGAWILSGIFNLGLLLPAMADTYITWRAAQVKRHLMSPP